MAALTALVGGLLTVPGTSATAGAPPAAAAPPGSQHTVTLITGDRVTVAEHRDRWELVRIEAASRVPASGFLQHVDQDGVTVIPTVAAPLVRSGQLDKALFDVSGLVELGYDDAGTAELPLLVESRHRAASALGRITRELPAAGLTAVGMPKGRATTLFDATTRSAGRIWLNGKAYPTLDRSVPQVGAPAAWAHGHTGAGTTIAVLDSGYDSSHPDLAGVVVGERDFVGGGMRDRVGHGTHVASTVAGRGTASGGAYTGVAKGANLLAGKVCLLDGCPFDAIIAGMQWAAESGARVVNLSFGGDPSDGTDPLSTELDRLTAAHGTLFVVAAGNWGAPETVSSPAAADSALAVASVTKQDTMSDFSARGPRPGDLALKPDIAAPGSDIVAAHAEGTRPGEAVDEHYVRISGTSMAASHVAGAGGILAALHPDWTAERLKSALMSSAHPVEAGVYEQGAGRLDVARAVRQQVTANPASLNLGRVMWPPTAQEPKKVAYRNDGTAPVTLSLALTAWHESGRPAPPGMFRTDVAEVTVPAGGEAAVTVRFDPTAGPPGLYGGRLVATAGDTVVRTTIGAYQEPENYDLTVNLVDRDGTTLPATARDSVATIVSLDDESQQYFGVVSTETVRLPAGRYALMAAVRTPIPGTVSLSTTSIGEPELLLDKDTTSTLDARRGTRVRLEVDERDARLLAGVSGMVVDTGKVLSGHLVELSEHQYAVPTDEPREHFAYYDRAQLEQPVIRLNVTAPVPFEVPVRWAPRSPTITDVRGLAAVDVGHARQDELAAREVRGKLAVFTLSLAEEEEMAVRLQAIADAGAAAIFFYFSERMSISTSGMPIPTMYTVDPSGVRLARLAAAGAPQVRLTGIRSSEYRYELAFPHRGGIPATVDYRPRNRDLATVRADYRALGDGEVAYVHHGVRSGNIDMGGGLWSTHLPLPVTRTEYYSPGPVSWRMSVSPSSDQDSGAAHRYRSAERSYRPGERKAVSWHKGVIAPALIVPEPYSAVPHLVYRDGDTIKATLPLLSDSARHSGLAAPEEWGFADRGHTALYAGDALVSRGEVPGAGTFSVPTAAGTYRLVSTVTRDHPSWPLSTSVRGEWTFRSGATDAATPLPLLAIGFDPKLDGFNNAPAGRRFTIPVVVDRQAGTTGPRPVLSTVEVSFDDGTTWQRLHPKDVGNHWEATVRHPASGFVSLRARAEDGDGNAVTETVIRAYRLR